MSANQCLFRITNWIVTVTVTHLTYLGRGSDGEPFFDVPNPFYIPGGGGGAETYPFIRAGTYAYSQPPEELGAYNGTIPPSNTWVENIESANQGYYTTENFTGILVPPGTVLIYRTNTVTYEVHDCSIQPPPPPPDPDPVYGRKFVNKPNYKDLVGGYFLDNRTVPSLPTIVPFETKTIKIKYYREDINEQIPNMKSIAWFVYKCDLIENIPYELPIVDCMLGSLYCDDSDILNAIDSLPTLPNKYDYRDLLPYRIPALFAYWRTLVPPPSPANSTIVGETIVLRKIAANNNVWNNSNRIGIDINPLLSHPMFSIEDALVTNRFLIPQPDGSTGTLMVDSPRLKEIHAALNAGNYLIESPAIVGNGTIDNPEIPATHTLDWYIINNPFLISVWKALGKDVYSKNRIKKDEDRYTNIGWYVENIARVLGIRFSDIGIIDSDREETYYTRKILNEPKYDKNAYSKNSFGKYGRLTPHLTNSNGNESYDKVADIPQLIEACFEHVNRSMGIQQGTEIEVSNSTTGKKDYYPNQLAMLLDIHAKVTEIQLNAKENHNLLQVVAHEIREMFSGIGIPVSFKSLWTRYGRFMYVGHQNDKGSLLTSLTTLKINIGMLVGNLLVDRPSDRRNPLQRMFAKPKKGE
jgi:hypothetical protein